MIYLAADHAGFKFKETLKRYLTELGFELKDFGAFKFDSKDDYPDFILPLAREIAGHPEDKGIIIGGSGEGEAMAANRIKGVRAAVFYGHATSVIKFSREHNDANVLSLGARFMDEKMAKEAVKLWLNTPFSEEERHKRRIKKIDKLL